MTKYTSYRDENLSISGYVWLLFVLFFIYFFYEHQINKMYPQSCILFLLLLNFIFRCIWFFFVPNLSGGIAGQCINRIAMLCQFTAFSCLMVVWFKLLHQADLTHRMRTQSLLEGQSNEGNQPQSDQSDQSDRSDQSNIEFQSPVENHARISNLNGFNQSKIFDVVNASTTKRIILLIVLNIVAWGFVLGTSAGSWKDDGWYDINIIAIAVLSFILALITIITQIWYYCQIFWLESIPTLELEIQKLALQISFPVTLVAFIFFLIRSFAFMYRPIADDYFNGKGFDGDVNQVLYPLFFYQLPEFLPNFVIAYGLSKENYILRSIWSSILTLSCNMSSNTRTNEELPITSDRMRVSPTFIGSIAPLHSNPSKGVLTPPSSSRFLNGEGTEARIGEAPKTFDGEVQQTGHKNQSRKIQQSIDDESNGEDKQDSKDIESAKPPLSQHPKNRASKPIPIIPNRDQPSFDDESSFRRGTDLIAKKLSISNGSSPSAARSFASSYGSHSSFSHVQSGRGEQQRHNVSIDIIQGLTSLENKKI